MSTRFPNEIHLARSGRGWNQGDKIFTSKFFDYATTRLGTNVRLSSARSQQTNGKAERKIGTLEEVLRNGVNYRQDNWAEVLVLVSFSTFLKNKFYVLYERTSRLYYGTIILAASAAATSAARASLFGLTGQPFLDPCCCCYLFDCSTATSSVCLGTKIC